MRLQSYHLDTESHTFKSQNSLLAKYQPPHLNTPDVFDSEHKGLSEGGTVYGGNRTIPEWQTENYSSGNGGQKNIVLPEASLQSVDPPAPSNGMSTPRTWASVVAGAPSQMLLNTLNTSMNMTIRPRPNVQQARFQSNSSQPRYLGSSRKWDPHSNTASYACQTCCSTYPTSRHLL
jgi:hypothetical protein